MMMRAMTAIVIFTSLSSSLLAGDWARYVNPRFGTAVDIPADYAADGPVEGLGDGKRFRAANGRSTVTAWGAPVAGTFSADIRARVDQEEAQGWAITYRSETPDWAAWGGTRSGHVFYAKTILVCDGTQTANVRLDYPAADIPSFDAIAMRLGQSLGQDGACF